MILHKETNPERFTWYFFELYSDVRCPNISRQAYGNHVTHIARAEMPRDWAPVSPRGATA